MSDKATKVLRDLYTLFTMFASICFHWGVLLFLSYCTIQRLHIEDAFWRSVGYASGVYLYWLAVDKWFWTTATIRMDMYVATIPSEGERGKRTFVKLCGEDFIIEPGQEMIIRQGPDIGDLRTRIGKIAEADTTDTPKT